MRNTCLFAGLLVLFATEVFSLYFLMPFTGSQEMNAINITYFFHHNILWLRIAGFLLIAYPLYYFARYGKIWKRILLLLTMAFYGGIYYYFSVYMLPQNIYRPIQVKAFAFKSENKISHSKLVIGVEVDGIAKAYPVQIVGYHHQLTDTIAGTRVLITYCTVCRSARVYDATIEGEVHDFNLVGMNKYNSVFEDEVTKSWWQQETGVAIAGPMKDKSLQEVPSQQVTLASWFKEHPDALVMQPDSNYLAAYGLQNNDRAYFNTRYLQFDTASQHAKALVIGVLHNEHVKAIDWDKLNYKRLIQDSMPTLALLFTLENDNASFHALNRNVSNQTLEFEKTNNPEQIKDLNTQSVWNLKGECIDGPLEGTQLQEVQSYLETAKSWNDFHSSEKNEDE